MQERRLRRIDKSTVGGFEYISDHILFGTMFGYNVYKFLPVVAPIASCHQSLVKLVLCMIITNVIGIGLSYKCNRTNSGMAADIFLGIGSYILFTIGAYKPGLVKALVITCIVLTSISLYAIFSSEIKRPDKLKQIILNRIRRSFLLVRRNAGVACSFAFFVIPVAVHFTSNEKIVNTYYNITGIEIPASQLDDYEVLQAYDDR